MQPIAVDCKFRLDGVVRIRRIKHQDQWLPVTQGRQWRDDEGLHILIMLHEKNVRELVLSANALTWRLKDVHPSDTTVV